MSLLVHIMSAMLWALFAYESASDELGHCKKDRDFAFVSISCIISLVYIMAAIVEWNLVR